MGRVALNAFTLVRWFVLFGILVYFVALPLMAAKAELVRFRLKAETVLAGVRVMTVCAARLDQRLMHKFLCHSGYHVIMADKA